MVAEAEQTSAERQLVVFNLGEEQYGVDISTVREIIRMSEITHVPDVPASVEGVLDLRGSVIPVVDLRKRFGLAVTKATAQSRVVVVELGGDAVGVIVDAVDEVLRIPVSSIETGAALVTTADSYYIDGIAKIDEELLILLDFQKALSNEALAKLAEQWLKDPPAFDLVDADDEEAQSDEADEADQSEAEPEAGEAAEVVGGPTGTTAELQDEGRAEALPEPAEGPSQDGASSELNIELLEATFELVAPRGDKLVEYFYEQLFERFPSVEPLFAEADMREQRGKLLAALTTVVATLRDPAKLTAHLEELGVRHLEYGVEPGTTTPSAACSWRRSRTSRATIGLTRRSRRGLMPTVSSRPS
jgi:purine-binding chemotaxis protein CheW